MLDQFHQELQREGQIALSVKVRPGASKTQVKNQLADGTLKIDVAAVPEDGKANAELIRFLAEEFTVSKANVELVTGQLTPRKQVRIVL